MTMIQLAAALISVLYGGIACLRHRQPLFFKILLYGLISYFFGALFTACYSVVMGAAPSDFMWDILVILVPISFYSLPIMGRSTIWPMAGKANTASCASFLLSLQLSP